MRSEEARGGVDTLRLALGLILFLFPAAGQAKNTIASSSALEGLNAFDWLGIQ
jgi:hypothetical protein